MKRYLPLSLCLLAVAGFLPVAGMLLVAPAADRAAVAATVQPAPQPERVRPQTPPKGYSPVRAPRPAGPPVKADPPIRRGSDFVLPKNAKLPCKHAMTKILPRAQFFVPTGYTKPDKLFRPDDRLMILCDRRAWWVIDTGGYWRQISGAREH